MGHWLSLRSANEFDNTPLTLKEQVLEIKDAYQKKMQTQLKKSSAKIDLLEAKAGSASADIKIVQAKNLNEFQMAGGN